MLITHLNNYHKITIQLWLMLLPLNLIICQFNIKAYNASFTMLYILRWKQIILILHPYNIIIYFLFGKNKHGFELIIY